MLRWLFTNKCPNCRQAVDKHAKFCRHCGWGNKNSWRNCTHCGVSVAADSPFCWNCASHLSDQPRDHIVSDRWRREPGVFAIRIPIESPNERLRHGVQVDEGVVGLLLRNGIIEAQLNPGYNEMTTFLGRLFGGGKPAGTLEAIVVTTQAVDVLVDCGPSTGLYTRDRVALEGAVMLTVELDDLPSFQRTMVPYGTELVRDDDLGLSVVSRVGEVLRKHAGRLSLQELATDLDTRSTLEAALGQELPRLLQLSGLKFGGVKDARFSGGHLDRLRDQLEDLSTTEHDNTWSAEKRRLTLSGELTRIHDETEFNEKVAELTHRYCLTQKERDHLLTMREIDFKGQQEEATANTTGHVQVVKTTWEIKRKSLEAEWEREQDMKDLEMARQMREWQLQQKEQLEHQKAEARRRELEDKSRYINSISGASIHAVLSVTDPEQGRLIVESVRAMNPEPRVIMQPASVCGPAFAPRYAASFMDLAHRLVHGVGVVVTQMPGGKLKACGTAWIVKGRGVLVTNAHVAEPVLQAHEEAGLSSCVMFPGGTYVITGLEMHPRYQNGASDQILPGFDVAVLQVNGHLPHEGLPLATRAKAVSLKQLQPVAYLGYPGEGLAGGGVNLERPQAMAKPGHITALTDWLLRASRPEDTHLVQHDIGVAGGASGSPLLDESGEVVGIVSAGNMQVNVDTKTQAVVRSPSAAMVNFAQRVDVLSDWTGW